MGAVRRTTQPPPPPEKEIAASIRRDLRLMGYTVKCTQQYRPRTDTHRGTTTDLGIPDLYVTHPRFGPNHWMALEVKRPGRYGRLSPEQKELVDQGACAIVTDINEALKALGDER